MYSLATELVHAAVSLCALGNPKCFSLSVTTAFPLEHQAKVTVGLQSRASALELLCSVQGLAGGGADLLGMMDHFI